MRLLRAVRKKDPLRPNRLPNDLRWQPGRRLWVGHEAWGFSFNTSAGYRPTPVPCTINWALPPEGEESLKGIELVEPLLFLLFAARLIVCVALWRLGLL